MKKQLQRDPGQIVNSIAPGQVERVTTKEWQAVLLSGLDRLRFYRGRGYDIKGTRVGPGVYELRMIERA
jgi:hypothetical protein